jgi:hypothetical protein
MKIYSPTTHQFHFKLVQPVNQLIVCEFQV